MTLHQSLLADLAAKPNPTARELMDASRLLEQIARIAYLEQFGHPEEAEKMRQRLGEK